VHRITDIKITMHFPPKEAPTPAPKNQDPSRPPKTPFSQNPRHRRALQTEEGVGRTSVEGAVATHPSHGRRHTRPITQKPTHPSTGRGSEAHPPVCKNRRRSPPTRYGQATPTTTHRPTPPASITRLPIHRTHLNDSSLAPGKGTHKGPGAETTLRAATDISARELPIRTSRIAKYAPAPRPTKKGLPSDSPHNTKPIPAAAALMAVSPGQPPRMGEPLLPGDAVEPHHNGEAGDRDQSTR
jgi:hypothetical protein